MAGPTAKTIAADHKDLVATLHLAGELDPPAPHLHEYENQLKAEVNANPYLSALLFLNFA